MSEMAGEETWQTLFKQRLKNKN